MTVLIDKTELMEHVIDALVGDTYEEVVLLEDIYETPTVDAVEVVKCKDCKHWHSNTEFCGIWSFQNIAQRTLSDDYCSRAERGEE